MERPEDKHPELGFKFRIGENVTTVGFVPLESEPAEETSKPDRSSWARTLAERRGPAKFFIIERQIVECPGGVQRLYTGRAFDMNGHTHERWFKFNEIELAAIPQK
jgi:hypothetical protein